MTSVLLFILLAIQAGLGVHSAPAQNGPQPADVQQDSGTGLP